MTNWWRDTPCKLHLDYHEPHWMPGVAGAFDMAEARAQAQMFEDAGIQAVSYFTHDHHGFTFWPAKTGRPHPGLANDYVANMTAALAERGIRRIAYFQLFTNIHVKDTHPEWLVTAPDGTNPPGAWMMYGASLVCASSAYLETYIAPLLTELLTTYDIESMWFDGGAWLIDTLCHCDNCRLGFRAETGLALPAAMPTRRRRHAPATEFEPRGDVDRVALDWSIGDDAGDADPAWIAWRIWRRRQIGTFLTRLVAICKAARPDVLVTDNSIGRITAPVPAGGTAPAPGGGDGEPLRWVPPQDLGLDYLCNDALPWGGDFPLVFSAVGRSEATMGLPFDFHNIRFHKWGEWQLRDAEDMSVDTAASLAQGAGAYFADQPYPDGRLEPAVYAAFAEANALAARVTAQTRSSVAVPDVAVLASAPSQIFGPIGSGVNAARTTHGALGVQVVGDRTDRIAGAHLALVHSGVQFLIYDEPTLRAALQRQGLVIVPEQCLMEDATVAALDAYVQGGGALIVTGRSGWWDEAYSVRERTRFDHILGIETLGAHPAPIHYVELGDSLRDRSGLPAHPIMQWGAAVKLRLAGAQSLADLRGPLRAVWRDGIEDEDHWQHYTTLGACPPGEDVVGPAVTLNRHGKGVAIFVAADPFAAHMHENRPHVMRFVQALMETAYPAAGRLISTSGLPPQVEVSVLRDADATFVHLVGYAPLKRYGAMAHSAGLPVRSGGAIRLRHPARPILVEEVHTGATLDWTWTDGTLSVAAPPFTTHAVIRVA